VNEKVRLHVGCGHRYLPGFVHIDQDHLEHVDHVRDIKDLSIFEDESVDEIYSCGTIIYFDRYEVRTVLKEWSRVLKKGGILRTSIADFEKMVQVYFDSEKNLDARGILGPLFGRWEIQDETEKRFIYQRTTYDFHSLRGVLETAGFRNVRRYNWRKFLPEGYDDYSRAYIPHMDESGLHLSLNVICEKE
jgi:predicted SAM-dependent methyltransferase|tara:strand:- start:6229 stop:6798 length:570 start_codon:yes stop_codon:yes gene_type:complete